jgi:hypothetical protein
VDACGYPGDWGSRGGGDPTNPAEAAKSIEAEDAIQADKAESDGVQAEIAFSAEVGQNNNENGPAENSDTPTQSQIDPCPGSAIEEAWWQWI